MRTTTATGAAIAVLTAGVIGWIALDGFAAGAVVLWAGVFLVIIGIYGWRDQEPAPVRAGDADLASGTGADPSADVYADDAPMTSHTTSPLPANERTRTLLALSAVARVWDELPMPDREAVADPETPPAPETPPRPETPPAAADAHRHAQPLVNHADLVGHLRDGHGASVPDGTTIQLRILHERAHPPGG